LVNLQSCLSSFRQIKCRYMSQKKKQSQNNISHNKSLRLFIKTIFLCHQNHGPVTTSFTKSWNGHPWIPWHWWISTIQVDWYVKLPSLVRF
jgi:hypothetical protein